MKIGITGAGGYIGAGLSARLMDKGHDVVLLDNFYNSQVNRIHGQEVIWADIRDRNEMEQMLRDCDIIIHLAAISGVVDCEKYPDKAYEVNVVGTANIAWVCRKYGIDLIFPSSMSVVGNPKYIPIRADHPRDPLNTYGFTKVMGEEITRIFSKNSFNALIFVKSNIYGEYDVDGVKISKRTVINLFTSRAKKGLNITVHKPGTQSRDFIHVLDVIDAYVLAVENMPEGCNFVTLGSGECLSVLDIAKIVVEHAENVEIDLVDNPRKETLTEDFRVDTEDVYRLIGFRAKRNVKDEIVKLLRG